MSEVWRSNPYKFTTTSLADPRIDQIRQAVRMVNKFQIVHHYGQRAHTKYRVCIRARLGKNSPNRVHYDKSALAHNNIKMVHGSRYDVYVYERRD